MGVGRRERGREGSGSEREGGEGEGRKEGRSVKEKEGEKVRRVKGKEQGGHELHTFFASTHGVEESCKHDCS